MLREISGATCPMTRPWWSEKAQQLAGQIRRGEIGGGEEGLARLIDAFADAVEQEGYRRCERERLARWEAAEEVVRSERRER
jgi:hypothetical protein